MLHTRKAQQKFQHNRIAWPVPTRTAEILNSIFAQGLGSHLILITTKGAKAYWELVLILFEWFMWVNNPSPYATALQHKLSLIFLVKITTLNWKYRKAIANLFFSLEQTCRQIYLETTLLHSLISKTLVLWLGVSRKLVAAQRLAAYLSFDVFRELQISYRCRASAQTDKKLCTLMDWAIFEERIKAIAPEGAKLVSKREEK